MTHVLKIKPAIKPELRQKIQDLLKREGFSVHGGGTHIVEPTYSDITFSFTGEREMPEYQCYKQVKALKIAKIERDADLSKGINRETDGTAMITPEEDGYPPFKVDSAYLAKHKPVVGGYYVAYKDGYKSFSPADVFEDGYTLLL